MSDIINNRFEIRFSSNITSSYIYSYIVPEIRKFYILKGKNKDIDLIWSFEDARYITANALPLLLSLGQILRDTRNKPTYISMKYIPELLFFLYTARFFSIAKNSDIFSYNEDLIGGFGQSIGRKYRQEHLTHVFKPDPIYPNLPKEEKEQYRHIVVENVTRYLLFSGFNQIVNDLESFSDETLVSSCYGEIVANAILYSESVSYLFAQTNTFGTNVSISDAGVGLASLDNKKKDNIDESLYMSIRDKYRGKGINDTFLGILDMMEYSKHAMTRKIELADHSRNLWTIWKSIMHIKGSMWIHTNNVRIKFDGRYCNSQCRMESFSECVDCLFTKQGFRYIEYPASLKGIHIEIYIPTKGRSER